MFVLAACYGQPTKFEDNFYGGYDPNDLDMDGFLVDEDCDDQDPSIGPPIYYTDSDQDGFGDANSDPLCYPHDHVVQNAFDCDDADPEVNPHQFEQCDDQIDNNCNGQIDFEDADCQ